MLTTLALTIATVAISVYPAIAGDVVGYHEEVDDLFVAVRGHVPANTVITGVRFYSNDATVFPEIALVADGGESRLPTTSETLRNVTSVAAQPGYVVASFDPFTNQEDAYLWIKVQFPVTGYLTGFGLGGGPGIGWADEQVWEKQRSFFSVDGSMNEFEKAFDVALVTSQAGKASATTQAEPPAAQDGPVVAAPPRIPKTALTKVVPNPANPSARVEFSLANATVVHLDVYNAAGRHVRTLEKREIQAGHHEVHWDGRDDSGSTVATGIYMVSLRAGGKSSSMKIVLAR